MAKTTIRKATEALQQGRTVRYLYRRPTGDYDSCNCELTDGALTIAHPTEPTGRVVPRVRAAERVFVIFD